MTIAILGSQFTPGGAAIFGPQFFFRAPVGGRRKEPPRVDDLDLVREKWALIEWAEERDRHRDPPPAPTPQPAPAPTPVPIAATPPKAAAPAPMPKPVTQPPPKPLAAPATAPVREATQPLPAVPTLADAVQLREQRQQQEQVVLARLLDLL